MATGKVKNWASFQHYKDRSPPWIKLHRELLDNFEYTSLPLASKALAPLVWLLAAETNDGSVNLDPSWLAWRLRMPVSEVEQGLTPLIQKGFLIGASGVLAECSQVAIPEREGETERETEGRASKRVDVDLLEGISPQVAADFRKLRKAKKAELTKTAVDGIKREAAKAGMTLEAVLAMCCERGWTGFKSEWVTGQAATPVSVPGGGRRAL